ncbi:YopX family protein [Listeria monocytogenes]|uniref:YopX family protein n=1 Tax=Listeria monocytogenes TaxID=1639 RepID=UPI002B002FDB|nr:YopX family protein [Listeria monocytogenes]
MREIEFRAKVKRSLQLEQIKNGWIHGGIFENKIISRNTNEGSICAGFCSEVEIMPETVGQFTGLRDKNGKKIFEGDIVEIIEIDAFGNLDWNRLKGKVMFSEGAWLVTDNRSFAIPLWSEINEIEVIGNIHENPELFEVAE